MPIQALYHEAETILRPAAGQLKIPLRLDERRGQLLSALPRVLKARGLSFCCPELPEKSAFSSLAEERGILVFTIGQHWYRSQLEVLSLPDWTDLTIERGVRANDKDNDSFLLSYTLRRCRKLQQRGGRSEHLDPALILLLLKGAEGAELARHYWTLSGKVRSDALLAGAVGRAVSRCFTKNSPTGGSTQYNGE